MTGKLTAWSISAQRACRLRKRQFNHFALDWGSPAVYGATNANKAGIRAGLFFGVVATAARLVLAGGRRIGQAGGQLGRPVPDGRQAQAGNDGELSRTPTAGIGGERGDIPTLLGLGEATEQQVNLPMVTGS